MASKQLAEFLHTQPGSLIKGDFPEPIFTSPSTDKSFPCTAPRPHSNLTADLPAILSPAKNKTNEQRWTVPPHHHESSATREICHLQLLLWGDFEQGRSIREIAEMREVNISFVLMNVIYVIESMSKDLLYDHPVLTHWPRFSITTGVQTMVYDEIKAKGWDGTAITTDLFNQMKESLNTSSTDSLLTQDDLRLCMVKYLIEKEIERYEARGGKKGGEQMNSNNNNRKNNEKEVGTDENTMTIE